ncbi:unnamed protein product, partial [marine sediment metagenome]
MEAPVTVQPITAPATPDAQLWDGYGTALKPAWEPIILARKPLDGTNAHNALTHGCGGLWIDGARIEGAKGDGNWAGQSTRSPGVMDGDGGMFDSGVKNERGSQPQGRWPANLILDEAAGAILDGQSGQSKETAHERGRQHSGHHGGLAGGSGNIKTGTSGVRGISDSGGASRFFYCAKPSKHERNAGLTGEGKQRDASRNAAQPSMNGGKGNPYNRGAAPVRNSHPTVKPVALLRWLLRLTRPPTGGIVLDNFCGSGSTGIAAVLEGRDFIGV